MNIFDLFTTPNITDEISNDLKFLNDTSDSYEMYETVSNEAAMLSTYLYEEIAIEDLKETVKKGLKYIWALLLKACISIGNILRRFIHFITRSKSALVLKKLDEELKEYEVTYPEIVKESARFWSDIDNIAEADVISVESGNNVASGPFTSAVKNTVLFRSLLVAALVQPKSKFSKTVSDLNKVPGFNDIITKSDLILSINDSIKVLNEDTNFSIYDLINSQVNPLENLANQLRKLTGDINIDTQVVNSFYNSNIIKGTDEYEFITKIRKLYDEVLPKRDYKEDFIETRIKRLKDTKVIEYIDKSYKTNLLRILLTIEKTFSGSKMQKLMKCYETIQAQIKPKFDKVISDNKDKNSTKEITEILKDWVNYISSTNIVLSKLGGEIGALRKSVNNM